jgi:glycosyltransferase involved in cell wall biosynthesis
VTRPRVSVVITTYNTGRYLPETLESVFAQTHPAAEVIVVDDGSTDDSVEVARGYGDRITSIARPHGGLGAARNAGIDASTGDHLAVLDSDDLWDPDTLRVQLEVAARHPESALIAADGVAFGVPGEADRPLFAMQLDHPFSGTDQEELTGLFHREFVAGNRIACPAQTLLPRWVHDALGPVCATPNGAQDYDYYLRITRSFPITFHRARLARWRFRVDSMSGAREDRRLRWAAQGVNVLAREREAATPAAKDYVDAAFHEQVRHTMAFARASLLAGHRPDPDDLDLVYRVAPRDPRVLGTRAILALPPAVGRGVTRGAHTAWGAVRRARR